MTIQPIGLNTASRSTSLYSPVASGSLLDVGGSPASRAGALLVKVQAGVHRAILDLGASPESRRRNLERLKAARQERRIESRARRKAAAAEAAARRKLRELIAIEKKINEREDEASALNVLV